MPRKSISILILIAIISLNLFFGLPRVKNFTGVDETLWSYGRIPKFWHSVSQHKWAKTDINDKPGITLAFLSGAGLPFIPNPKNYSKIKYETKTPAQLTAIENIYLALRLPIYIFSLFSLIFFYFLLKRLLDYKTALVATSFIGLSPILLGISLILNPDSLLWIFMPLSLISFLIYQKENNRKFLVLSGFILGLALLTKYVANLLFPFFLLLIFFKYIFEEPLLKDSFNYFKKSFEDYLILIISALAAISIFYPRIWVKSNTLLYTTIFSQPFIKIWPFFLGFLVLLAIDIFLFKSFFTRRISNFLRRYRIILIKTIIFITLALIIFIFINTYAGMKFSNFENIFFDPKGAAVFPAFFSSFFPLIFGLSPLILGFFILAIISTFKSATKIMASSSNWKYVFHLLSFILIYYLANSLARVGSTIRYQIVIYPIAFIISAIGLTECLNSKIVKRYFPAISFYGLFVFLFICLGYSLFSIRPFYFSYASSLLPKQYILNPRYMGVGGWEVSQY
ncbi:MAG TPA: phospholipid carrier-dependent glycosyltransferase, partial [Candidatus Moranbacteria bacterium]|nr:phospholipid carrier-dependent glycosyltransferase [Candidatus Moranbacteria bacterium]